MPCRPSPRPAVGALVLALACTTVPGAPAPAAGSDDPRPWRKHTWTEADKTGFGTARERASNVWFTLQDGRTTEVFYPDLSTPSVRALELRVSDEEGTFDDRASTDMTTTVTRSDPESLRFTSVHEDDEGRYRLTETHLTDPERASYLVRVRLESLDGGSYRLHADLDPALANTGNDDRARTSGDALVATDGRVSAALVAEPALTGLRNGYVGGEEGTAPVGPGNVWQTAEVSEVTGQPGSTTATLALGFGRKPAAALATARASAGTPYGALEAAYDAGWRDYLGSLRPVPTSVDDAEIEDAYLASVLVVAAAEDKRNPGAFIASPSAPWVWGDDVPDLSKPSGAYHLVWSRDAYEFGTALWAVGDEEAARRIVEWLFDVQQKADGSFPQNSDVRGRPVWGELQLDEVALPIALACLTGTGAEHWDGIRRAAQFLAGFRDEETGRRAPYSPQERWENQSGYSPNSIAAQITGLVCAGAVAREEDHPRLARRWLGLADAWQRRVDDWTVTTNGPLGDDPYYLRLTKDGRPDRGTTYPMGDGGPKKIDQRKVVDPSFLALVRLGIRDVSSPAVTSTLEVIDDRLGFETPHGPFWHRFSFDGYGETRDGGQWEITESGTFDTLGRGWPILTAERGEYVVAAGQDAAPYLSAVAGAAGPSGMISEQVWDGRPPTGDPCCPLGEGTRAATPLVWSHAALVRLAWTMELGTPVDQQAIVADRYR